LVVEFLIILHKCDDLRLCRCNLLALDRPFVENAKCVDEATKVGIINSRKYLSKVPRAKAEYVQDIFSNFVATIDLLSRVAGWSMEERGEVGCRVSNGSAMGLPCISDECPPWPGGLAISDCTINSTSPDWYQKLTEIEEKVHHIRNEREWRWNCERKTTEDTGLWYACFPSIDDILCLVWRLADCLESLLIPFEWRRLNIVEVEVVMHAAI
jgi:hypothetical protein